MDKPIQKKIMTSTTEENQKGLQNSAKIKNEQIMKMFCNDIKEINSQNEVNYYYKKFSADGHLYTAQSLQEIFKLQKF